MKQRMHSLPLALAVAAATPYAVAQEAAFAGIEEVVVTAQKRAESLQDTPIAMSAFTENTLEAMGTVDFSGVAVASPSLNFTPYPNSSNTLILYMRGQGANDAGQITKDGAVGMYVDGVFLARPQAMTMDLADVERVEVLRGPQGTLYGRNTTGGAVNIITKKPSGEFGFKEHLTIGNRGKVRSLTMVDLPAMGDVAAKISYVTNKKDGHVENPFGHDFSEEDQQGARLAVRWDVSDTVVVDYAFEMASLETTPSYYQTDALNQIDPSYSTKPHSTAQLVTNHIINLPMGDTDVEGHSLTVEWEANENITAKSITGYRELVMDYGQDYLDAMFLGSSNYESLNFMENRQFSQEFQLVGSAMDERLDYVTGLYYFEESSRQDLTSFLFGGATFRGANVKSNSWAVFGQATYFPSILEERLSFTVGLRYTEDEKEGQRIKMAGPTSMPTAFLTEPVAKNSVDFESLDPTFTANYEINGDVSVYGKLATAYKSGGFGESSLDFTESYEPENITSYELGLKSFWLDRRVRLNMAAFWTDYDDMQVDLSPTQVLSEVNTYNAGTATINGVEMDLMIQPTANLTVTIDYTYLDWEIEEIIHPGSDLLGVQAGTDVTSWFSLPYAPEHSYHVGVDYSFDPLSIGQLDLRVDYSWQDETFMSAGTKLMGNDRRDAWTREDYGLVDARLTLTMDMDNGAQLRLAAWGKNIENKRYEASSLASFSKVVSYSEPRSYGLDVIYEY